MCACFFFFFFLKVEVERALVEAEQESEIAALQHEKDALEALHNKIADLETQSQQEKEKVFKLIHSEWDAYRPLYHL